MTNQELLTNIRVKTHDLDKIAFNGEDESNKELQYLKNLIKSLIREAFKRGLSEDATLQWAIRTYINFYYPGALIESNTTDNKNILDKMLTERRTVRHFDKDKKVSKEQVLELINAGRWAPSACNRQPVRYLVLETEKAKTFTYNIRKDKTILRADKVIAILVDKSVYNSVEINYTPYLDAAAAIQNILLKAYELDLGACWINFGMYECGAQGLDKFTNNYNIPDNLFCLSLIAIGNPANKPRQVLRKDFKDIIMWEEQQTKSLNTVDFNKDIVVSCPIKNDNEYLVEFVEHYLKLGFDKIYFYDNNDDDTVQPYNVLKEYINADKVVVIDYRNNVFHDVYPRRHFYKEFNFEWVLFVDDDEFLELKKHRNVKEFLSSFENDVTKIAINNIHYGDNEIYYSSTGNVQDRFVTPLPLDSGTEDFVFNSAIKSFIKKVDIDDYKDLNPHSLLNKTQYCNADNKRIILKSYWQVHDEDITYDTANIKHYCTKSLEEFIKCKVKRAKSNNRQHKERFGIDSYYFMYNESTKEKEELVKVFLKKYL